MRRNRAGSGLNWVDEDGVFKMNGRGRDFALGNSHVHNIGDNIVYDSLLVHTVVGDGSCDCQGSAENSDDG